MANKWVYTFKEGNMTMRNLLGGKGANLAEMTEIGLPVPQGFTITTEACTQYYEDGKVINPEIQAQIMEYVDKLEKMSGKKFGEKLEHRQVLGALLGQGIERDALGDVLVEGAEAYSFCLPSLQEEIASLQEVGPHKIQVKFVPQSSMNFSPRIEIRHGTISSNRLDGVISEMFSCSRAQAQEAIDASKIFLGGTVLHQKDMEVEEGTILTFRGKGKGIFYKEKGSAIHFF